MRSHRMRAAAGNKGPSYEVKLGGTTSDYYVNNIREYDVPTSIASIPSGISFPGVPRHGWYIFYFRDLAFAGNQKYTVKFLRDGNNSQVAVFTFTLTSSNQYNRIVSVSTTALDDTVRIEIRKGGEFDPIVWTGYFNRTSRYYFSDCNGLGFYNNYGTQLKSYFFGQIFNETCYYFGLDETICDSPTCPEELPDLVQIQECQYTFTNGVEGSTTCGPIIDSYCDDFTFYCG